jgi:mannose-6-phosphate isomerase-like protein (cupin superfamily)
MQMTMTFGKGLLPNVPLRQRVENLQREISKLPQYEPKTTHTFHAGMYCREVWRPAGVLVVGKVHKKEHFYLIVSGTVAITTDDGVQLVTGPQLLCSTPGTKRAVYAETDALCMTFHVVDAKTIEDAEAELVETDANDMYTIGNTIKDQQIEVTL